MTSYQDLNTEVQALSDIEQTAEIRQCVVNSFSWLKSAFNSHNARELVELRATFVDTLLAKCWQLMGLDKVEELSLLAVGGYGRGQLHPYSDIDLLFLYKNKINRDVEQSLSQFITLLWDIKLDVGQSVRSIDETLVQGKADITVATNVIESRYLCGCRSTFALLQNKIQSNKFWSSQDYYLGKKAEQEARHKKYHGNAYTLEPNLKENPGCLRDIQTSTWVAKKHFNVPTAQELVDNGYLKGEEFRELIECRDFIWQLRFALHIHTGRNENRLLFDHQPDVAELMGYGRGKLAVETMMKGFFRIVRKVIELNSMLLQHFDNQILASAKRANPLVISDDYQVQQGLLNARHSKIFSTPESLLQLFEVVADNPSVTGIHSDTLRLLRSTLNKFKGTYLSSFEQCRIVFMQLVKHPDFFGKAWDLMQKHDVTRAYLGQWDHIVGLMQFDMFHAYTVDEHTHRLIKNIYNYTQKSGELEFPRCSRIMRYAEKPELLYLAAIFHDIAKGKGGDHSELGEVEALQFAELHQLSKEDTEFIAWLVKNHLLMSVVAQRRDIHDPQVIADFAEKVGTEERLSFLFALTSADIRATNDSLWNQWKASLLRDTFLYTKDYLRNEGIQNIASRISYNKTQAMQQLYEKGFDEKAVHQLWQTFDEQYFFRNRPAHISWHTETVLNAKVSDLPHVVWNSSIYRGGTALLIYAHDRSGLFAQIASALDNKGYSIHDAQIMSTTDNYALDTLIVADNQGHAVTNPETLNKLAKGLQKQLKDNAAPKVKRRTSRQIKQFNVPTKVGFLPPQNELTVMEISALDTPGLLARITAVIAQQRLNLHAAKVSTIGEKVEDFFIISTGENHQLSKQQQTELKQQLISVLDTHNIEHVKA